MSPLKFGALGLMIALSAAGCGATLSSADDIFPTGTPFIVSGTAALVDSDGPCLVWIGDNGETYHLFQGLGLDNESFDQITTTGTVSRLQLATRSDLVVACQVGTIVEVQDVLEIAE